MSWHGKLALKLAKKDGQTVLVSQRHSGPLLVQKPFYPEGKTTCHLYLLHPPGGMVAGDRLRLQVNLGANSHLLLTTPSAAKFYRSLGNWAVQQHVLRLAEGAICEWFPQENIAYNRAKVRLQSRIHLAKDACFLGWDITCLGRAFANERFTEGSFCNDFELWQQNQPIFIEHARVNGQEDLLHASVALRGLPVSGFFIAYPCSAVSETLAARWPLASDALCSATQIGMLLVCRYLGWHAEEAKACFFEAWRHARKAMFGKDAVSPRIWAM